MNAKQKALRFKKMEEKGGLWSIAIGCNNVDWLYIVWGKTLWTLRGFLRRY